MTDPLEITRKRLIFRSWHRGTREIDLILGSFADKHVPEFSAEELTLYENLLQENDPDLYNWISGREAVPANVMNPVLEMLLSHRIKTQAKS